ncbi:hypothetical protein DXG01_009941 [Tephrocybe rancida]|nr:hypothetical protein DXG01_009941 [Tephrocybe rancida]
MPPRRKPTSTRQKKADTQLKRAIKRGDVPPPEPQKKTRKPKVKRGPTGNLIGSASDPANAAAVHAARRLQSAFVTLPPKFLEETKALASQLPLPRPIQDAAALYTETTDRPTDSNAHNLTCPRRPKWRFDMTKKEVEHNEEGLFRKWMDQMDGLVLDWQNSGSKTQKTILDQEEPHTEPEPDIQELTEMPRSPTYFERNLEVWRQLWRVTEISQILLVLLDSRCPLLHFPPSLAAYLSDRKVILVLTKVDISGPERASAWTNYFRSQYPHLPVVQVESYAVKEEGVGHQGRAQYEPHLPASFRERLVTTIREVHAEMLIAPEKIRDNPKRLSSWKPTVKTDIDWDSLLKASDSRVGIAMRGPAPHHPRENDGGDSGYSQDDREPEYLTIGLIGQPNVGKSSLLNALFGTSKVRASKTPGKTKHFQTLFWTPDVRLVDCPGLVMPNFVPMEMQVLCGILPIARVSAVPSSIHFAAERIPIERVYGLEHPSLTLPPVADKRTWRDGMRAESVGSKPLIWTAMDVLTSYANLKRWVTAKAGRPDIHRAGNAILRAMAEGKVGWAFWPPETAATTITAITEGQGTGIWIPRATVVEDETDNDSGDDDSDPDQDENPVVLDSPDEVTDEETSDDEEEYAGSSVLGVSRFGALAIEEEEAFLKKRSPKESDYTDVTSRVVDSEVSSSNLNQLATSKSMLNWFGSKDHDKTNDSTVQSNLRRINTETNDGADKSLPPTHIRPPTGFTSPHDVILAQMRGQPHIQESDDGLLYEEVPGPSKEEPYLTPSLTELRDTTAPKEVVYEPYDGTPIGLLTPPPFDITRQPAATTLTDLPDGKKEEQWEHLSQVLDLQNEVARMHLEMEGVGIGDGKGKTTGKGRKGKGKADLNTWENRTWGDLSRGWKPKRQATTDTIGADTHEGDEEGVDAAGDEEIEVKKAREEAFSTMADQFEGRKESIQGIMSKLDELSKALTQFHTLQAPTFEFTKASSRQNSTTPDVTPPQQSKVTPYVSATLPNAGTDPSDAFRLRPVLPSAPSSLTSTPQAVFEPETGSTSVTVLPASLRRSTGIAAREPLIVNVMDPGKQTHVMDSPDSMGGFLPPEYNHSLPPVSAGLKPIIPYLQRANELRTQDPVMTYWCAYHAAQVGIALKAKDPASRDVLFALLGFLERLKKEIGPTDALDIESVSSAYVENFAFKVFGMADNEDRTGSATRSTAKKFLAAAHFLEVLKIFPKAEISESTEEKITYAKWKAADIAKAFREGRRPVPGPAEPEVIVDHEATPPASPPPRVDIHEPSPTSVGGQSDVFVEHSSPFTHVDISQAPMASEPRTPPHFTGAYLDVGSYEGGVLVSGGGEATPGSWSTAATPGADQAPSDEWNEQPSPMRGSQWEDPSEEKYPKRKAWVSEELESDSREYISRDSPSGDQTVDTVSDSPSKKSVHFTPPVSGGLSESSIASSSAPSSPLYGENIGPYSRGAAVETSWPSEQFTGTYEKNVPSVPRYPPNAQVDLGILPLGFVPDSLPSSYTGSAGPSHSEHTTPPSVPSVALRHSTVNQPYKASRAYPDTTPSAPPPPQHYAPPSLTTTVLTPSIIAKAQKHCRFAISSLDYEDAEQARKELRAALAMLGG